MNKYWNYFRSPIFGGLEINITKVVPEELIEIVGGLAEFIFFDIGSSGGNYFG
jgi:hypothetical protein